MTCNILFRIVNIDQCYVTIDYDRDIKSPLLDSLFDGNATQLPYRKQMFHYYKRMKNILGFWVVFFLEKRNNI